MKREHLPLRRLKCLFCIGVHDEFYNTKDCSVVFFVFFMRSPLRNTRRALCSNG